MLKQLRIINFAIIDKTVLDFNAGLTTITGETGAGKSILLGALRLVLGDRADIKSVKDPENKSIIEAVFDIRLLGLNAFFEENDLDYEDESILRREILPSGKSRAFVNDTPVTLDVLNELSQQLIDIHSQNNTRQLLDSQFQLRILDAMAGNSGLLEEYQKGYSQYVQLQKKLQTLQEAKINQSADLDYKIFLFQELSEADLIAGELENLESEHKELANLDEIIAGLSESIQSIEHPEIGIQIILRQVANRLSRLGIYSDDLSSLSERTESIQIELDDIAQSIQQKIDKIEVNPERLNEVSTRIDLIQNLLRKHKVNTDAELLDIKLSLEQEISGVENSEEEIQELIRQIDLQEELLNTLGNRLSENRKKSIPKTIENLLKTLSVLGMDNAFLEIELQAAKDFTSTGLDQVRFLFSANKGIQAKEIDKAISGGEQSRVMLAIKKLLASHLKLPTLILDEIDTGISGKVADETGKLMKEMGADIQLIVITHLPQVASKGSTHLKVYKETTDISTHTRVKELNTEERLQEIAQMISGSVVSDSAVSQAKALIDG